LVARRNLIAWIMCCCGVPACCLGYKRFPKRPWVRVASSKSCGADGLARGCDLTPLFAACRVLTTSHRSTTSGSHSKTRTVKTSAWPAVPCFRWCTWRRHTLVRAAWQVSSHLSGNPTPRGAMARSTSRLLARRHTSNCTMARRTTERASALCSFRGGVDMIRCKLRIRCMTLV